MGNVIFRNVPAIQVLIRLAVLIVLLIPFCVGQVVFQPIAVTPPGTNTGVNLIIGTVRGTDGSVISSGSVAAFRQSGGTAPRKGRTSASANIGSDGSFSLPYLVDGVYIVCAEIPNTVWLNPCEWGGNAVTVSLPAKPGPAQVSISLAKGAPVTVRVNDPGQLLTANEGKTPGAHLLLGMATDGLFFRQAGSVSQDSAGRTYQLLIPFDRSLRVSVASGFFQVTDAIGRPLSSLGGAIPIQIASGESAATVVLNITGIQK